MLGARLEPTAPAVWDWAVRFGLLGAGAGILVLTRAFTLRELLAVWHVLRGRDA